MHIQISLGTKFQIELTILIFWTKLAPKAPVENRFKVNMDRFKVQGLQAFAFYVVNVNSTVVFEHSEDLQNFITLNILKEKLVIFCLLGFFFYLKIVKSFSNCTVQIAMIKFGSKFQF